MCLRLNFAVVQCAAFPLRQNVFSILFKGNKINFDNAADVVGNLK